MTSMNRAGELGTVRANDLRPAQELENPVSENAAARVPPPENARMLTRLSLLLVRHRLALSRNGIRFQDWSGVIGGFDVVEVAQPPRRISNANHRHRTLRMKRS
jgi:hypothetical protein